MVSIPCYLATTSEDEKGVPKEGLMRAVRRKIRKVRNVNARTEFGFFPSHLAHCSSVMTKLMNYLLLDIRNREKLVQNKDKGKK